jgi:hypothetical protein
MRGKDKDAGLTSLERDVKRAMAVLDKALPLHSSGPNTDRTAMRAAALPVILAELLALDYRDDGPYAEQFSDMHHVPRR